MNIFKRADYCLTSPMFVLIVPVIRCHTRRWSRFGLAFRDLITLLSLTLVTGIDGRSDRYHPL